MTGAVFERITVIGLGLIGSSIARAARTYHLADIIVGCDPNEVALTYARSHKFIDVGHKDAATASQTSQMVILATPPATLADIAKQIAPALTPGTIIMDTASVKQPAMEAIAPHLPPGVDFIPAHPIAGSEQSGVAAGRADLFERKTVIVTPSEPAGTALQAVTRFWKGMGARIEGMPAPLHDMIYGYVSHLPQLLAFAAKETLAGRPAPEKFLRIAGSSPALWMEIFALNKTNLLAGLDRYLDAIKHVEKELAQAPENEIAAPDELLAYSTLFPRLAASCLITTVMEAEKKAGFAFARYAGSGFADFTSPAAAEPDTDIERISGQHTIVRQALRHYAEHLASARELMVSGKFSELQKCLSKIQKL